MTACFFGHREIAADILSPLAGLLERLIGEGADTFLVGNQGGFDHIVLRALRLVKEKHPQINYSVVLAYLPEVKKDWMPFAPTETIYPEGLESVPRRFAISWRNKWMIQKSDIVVTYITHSWGGAAQFAEFAKKHNKRVINIADNP